MVPVFLFFCVDLGHDLFFQKVKFFLDFCQSVFPQLSDSLSDRDFLDLDGLSDSALA